MTPISAAPGPRHQNRPWIARGAGMADQKESWRQTIASAQPARLANVRRSFSQLDPPLGIGMAGSEAGKWSFVRVHRQLS